MVHELKTWPEYFVALTRGMKCFELRKNDRDFKAGDFLELKEWDPRTKAYTGHSTNRRVWYVLKAEDAPGFGLQEGFCILGL